MLFQKYTHLTAKDTVWSTLCDNAAVANTSFVRYYFFFKYGLRVYVGDFITIYCISAAGHVGYG